MRTGSDVVSRRVSPRTAGETPAPTALGLPDGRAPRRPAPRYAAAAHAPGARARLPAAGVGRLAARRHGPRPAGRVGALGGRARRAEKARRPRVRHPLPPRPRRGGGRRERPDRRPCAAGPPRLRAVRARVGERRLGARARRVVSPARRAHARHGRADRAGRSTARSSATPPIRCSSTTETGSTAGRSWPHPVTPTASSPSSRTACSSSPITRAGADHAGGGARPESRPDPLGDFLTALERTIALEPTLALPGHGDPIEDPVGRARELIEHHRERLDATAAALSGDPATGYEVSYPLFGVDLKPAQRRFAVAETLSHLERLVLEGPGAPPRGRRPRLLYCALSGRRAAAQYQRPVHRGAYP